MQIKRLAAITREPSEINGRIYRQQLIRVHTVLGMEWLIEVKCSENTRSVSRRDKSKTTATSST